MVPSSKPWKGLALFRESINNYVSGGQLLLKKCAFVHCPNKISRCQSLLHLLTNPHYFSCGVFMNPFHTHLLILALCTRKVGKGENRCEKDTVLGLRTADNLLRYVNFLLHWFPFFYIPL